jgi:hypothetical protein
MEAINEDEVWETSMPMIQEESSKMSKYSLPPINIKEWNHKGELNEAQTPRNGHNYHDHRKATVLMPRPDLSFINTQLHNNENAFDNSYSSIDDDIPTSPYKLNDHHSDFSYMVTDSPYIQHENKKGLVSKLKRVFTGKKGGFSIYDEHKGIDYTLLITIVSIVIIIIVLILFVTGAFSAAPSTSNFINDKTYQQLNTSWTRSIH